MAAPAYTPQVGDKVKVCGYSFIWTEGHLSKEDIEPLRQQYDALATDTLARIQEIRARAMEESKERGINPPPTDLYTILRDHHREDATLSKFWDEVNTVPSWVDWDQLARGQRFLYRYAIANIVGFALQGFMAENTAAPGVVEVLVRTGGFSTRILLGRLLETFQWLIQVTHHISAIQPGGEGHIDTVRVRLLHTAVRQRILHLSRTHPNYFDTEQYGIPVNLLDGIHSISTFCCNPMWLQLPKLGITPSLDERRDYIALFRYLGYLLGTPSSYFATAEQGKLLMESLLVHEVRLTETSQTVAFNFLQCVTNLPAPFHISKGFIEAGSRWISGDEFCDDLRLEKPNFIPYLAFIAHCLLVTILAWMQRVLPGFDRMVITFFQKRMYHGVVLRKSRTRFDFKYIPKVGKQTRKESFPRGDQEGGKARVESSPSSVDVQRLGHFEMVLLFVAVIVGGVSIGGVVEAFKWIISF